MRRFIIASAAAVLFLFAAGASTALADNYYYGQPVYGGHYYPSHSYQTGYWNYPSVYSSGYMYPGRVYSSGYVNYPSYYQPYGGYYYPSNGYYHGAADCSFRCREPASRSGYGNVFAACGVALAVTSRERDAASGGHPAGSARCRRH